MLSNRKVITLNPGYVYVTIAHNILDTCLFIATLWFIGATPPELF